MVHPGFAWMRQCKSWMGQREFLDKAAYSHLLDFGLWPFTKLPPTQTMGIPGFQSKTPVAQMHFVSELPLSQGSYSINGLKMSIQSNP